MEAGMAEHEANYGMKAGTAEHEANYGITQM